MRRLLIAAAAVLLAWPAGAVVLRGSGSGPDVTAPEVSTATIGTDGTTLTLGMSETVTRSGGTFDVDCSTAGSNLTATYSSGSGSSTLVYTIGTTVNSGDSCDLDYDGASNGIEDGAGNDLAAIVSGSVTNGSEQGAGDSCTGGLLFSWHAEDTTVTNGTPAGCSVGDTTAAATGSVELSTTQKSDGTYSVYADVVNEYYSFGVSSYDIIKNTAGTLVLDLYVTTNTSPGNLWRSAGGADYVSVYVETGNPASIRIYHNAGGTLRNAVKAASITPNTWHKIIARWSETAVSGKYLSISVDGGAAGTSAPALGTIGTAWNTMEIGTRTTNLYAYIDNVQIYDSWLVSDPR